MLFNIKNMKKLVTILVLLFTFAVNAQEKEDPTPVLSETERIVDKYGSKLAESFSEFMETATPMAQEGFKIVVRLQIAKGICRLLFIPLSIFCVWFFYKNLNSINLEEKDGKEISSGDLRIGALVISGLIGIIAIIAAIFQTSTGLQMLIAPEWFAIKEIAELF